MGGTLTPWPPLKVTTWLHTCKIGIPIPYLTGTMRVIGTLVLSSVRMHLLIHDKFKKIEYVFVHGNEYLRAIDVGYHDRNTDFKKMY